MRVILRLSVALVLATGCQPAENKSAAPADGKAATTQTPPSAGST